MKKIVGWTDAIDGDGSETTQDPSTFELEDVQNEDSTTPLERLPAEDDQASNTIMHTDASEEEYKRVGDEMILWSGDNEAQIEQAANPETNSQQASIADTLESKILQSIVDLTFVERHTPSKDLIDISNTELTGMKFLITQASKTETLDYFKIVQQILASKKVALGRDPVLSSSPNLDELILFIENIAASNE